MWMLPVTQQTYEPLSCHTHSAGIRLRDMSPPNHQKMGMMDFYPCGILWVIMAVVQHNAQNNMSTSCFFSPQPTIKPPLPFHMLQHSPNQPLMCSFACLPKLHPQLVSIKAQPLPPYGERELALTGKPPVLTIKAFLPHSLFQLHQKNLTFLELSLPTWPCPVFWKCSYVMKGTDTERIVAF